MRRRPPMVPDSRPAELLDAASWPLCARWDGGSQPCCCWFAAQQQEWIDAGNEWPGNDLADLLKVFRVHQCAAPFDGSQL